MFNREMCGAGQDFILQVSPTGCIPSVVRSDILEEQNVPVFCPIVATQLNPLIDVEAVNNMIFSFSGGRPPEVSGIGYYPARAALGRTGQVTQPVLNNLGYAVVVLKQQRNESSMSDFVGGNLTAKIRYDVKNAFGVGQAIFYLPEMTDDEWNRNFKRYSFWDGRGYLRAESIGDDRASISIYSDRETYGLTRTTKRKIATKILGVGETSEEIFIPGFDYCLGSTQLKLNGLESPDTTASLNINGDILELKEKEKFIDNKCRVKSIDKQGIVEKVTIDCDDDYGSGTFPLTIRPRIKLNIDGVTRDYSVGDRLLDGDGAPFLVSDRRKTVFLAYANTDEGLINEQNLSVSLIAIPGTGKTKLSETELNSIARFLNSFPTQDTSSIFSSAVNIYKAYASTIETVFKIVISGETLQSVHFKESEKDIFGKTMRVVGFAGSRDSDLSQFGQEFENYYENAIEDYNTIIESYSEEKYPENSETSLGEEALYNKIELMWMTNQKRTAVELCEEFEDKYPNKILPENCEKVHKLSNTEISSRNIEIDGIVYRIAFDRIREPTFDDFGTEISVWDSVIGETRIFQLRKNTLIVLNETRNEFIQLLDLDEDIAKLRVNLRPERDIQGVLQFLSLPRSTLRRNLPETFGSRYTFTLQKVNLKKVAKVSVKPNIRYTETEATFPFRIGIEKRAIQLSPEKTEERIESLNNTIEKWRSISNKLEAAVKVGKAACLGVGAGLTVTNFFANLKGEGVARQNVMRGPVGWFAICEAKVIEGTYNNVDSCLLANNAEIESSVERYAGIITTQNERDEELQEGITKTRFLGEDVVDTKAYLERYVGENYTTEVRENTQNLNEIRVGNQDVDVSEIIDLIGPDTISVTQARSLELNSILLNSENEVLRNIAENQIKADLGDIWVNAKNEVERKHLSDEWGFPVTIGSRAYLKDVTITHRTTFEDVESKFSDSGAGSSIDKDSYVHIFVDESDGNEYLLVLTDSDLIDKTYLIKPGNILEGHATEDNQKNPLRLSIKYYDQDTYKNKYKNAEVRYYAAGQYKGFPAIVPFDINNGWYVATKPAVPILGGIQPYYDSGRASSFYLCNVGPNGREEFFSEIGDDICRGFVADASQPPDFPGLSASESLNKRIRAEEALREAQRKYRPGANDISIFGQKIDVGAPTVGIPDIQCQDFMSPSNCNLLFNVCDPVICPSSRCDLGGTYPVSDVVQSGIIGSLALCLPNFPEVKIPVCLSGVHAGLEAYLSVVDSYQACLETSLETGQTIGICDELHSVYMCDFFWRQSLPLVKYAIPQVIGSILGKNVRGGGEYLGFQDAWQRAGDSVGFFTQYYAANSFQAFKARSAEEIGTEVCKNWVSLIGPGNGKLFDALIEPDVPPQFYGRFDEIPFTTATVPAMSHYKVFYHVYAGKEFPAYYQVYIKGTGEAFYRDVPTRRMVASGFIKAEEYATETKDFTAPAGYNELCIVVNNKEECGFKQVTTEFGMNYITEQYIKEQASTTDITTEASCVSGTPNVLSLLSPNIQAGVEEGINPAIYNRGITRICATSNPGKATDPFIGTENERWTEVGYCDTPRLKCWLDTKSVKDTIKITSIEEQVLEDVKPDYLDVLVEEGDYVENFKTFVSKIKEEKNPSKKIELINEKYNKVYFMSEKGYLTFLRGNVYDDLARMEISLESIALPTETTIPEGLAPFSEPETEEQTETCLVPIPTEDVLTISNPQERVLETIEELNGESAPGPACFDSIEFVYKSAGVARRCVYSDEPGQSYIVDGKKITIGIDTNDEGESIFLVPTESSSCEIPIGALNYQQKLNQIKPGDRLDIVWGDKSSHAVIFIDWLNREEGYARIFDWIGGGYRTYGYQDVYLTENIYPVYLHRSPYIA
jgi:hypothetical protein